MPLICESRCDDCAATEHRTDGYCAIYCDPPAAGDHPEEPRLRVLAHPAGSLILEELGLTYLSASLEGRWVEIGCLVCRACGRSYETRRLGASGAVSGCLFPLGVGAVIGIASGVMVARFEGWLEAVGGGFVLGMLGAGLISDLLDRVSVARIRRRYAERARALDRGTTCPHCGANEGLKPSDLKGQLLPCPACGGRSVRTRHWGIS